MIFGRLINMEIQNAIIGAGAMGSAAAYHLARRGEPVWVFEQFVPGHDRGSSHGAARITRHSYADAAYARLMPDAFRAWRALEADAGEPLYVRTGGVSFCPRGVDYVARVAANLEALDVPSWRGAGRDWNQHNRMFSLPDDHDVVFEPDAGMLAASRAVALQLEVARSRGGDRTRVLEQTPVRRIDLEGERPVIVTDTERITAERLIVAAGGWARRLLPAVSVPLTPTRQRVLYFRPDDRAAFQIGRFPVFIYQGASAEEAYYGMPEFLERGAKAARHCGPETNPDIDDRAIDDAYVQSVRRFLKEHMPALAAAPIEHTETCLYTVAPDERFLVDFLPGRNDVVVASPCSGHGFKFSCLIGRVLADLASDGTSDVPIDAWKALAGDQGQTS